ncbi:helix-turn-helix domain-containing protein [Streptomyces sp. NPDC048018]|uniref:helix-turn-helix domain-containing protein n=1 Tax=Streptomyces sp. NPDC048018 TaxID=3365499 RepID=UPI0037135962
MTLGETPPDPREARSPAEFIARLRALKDWSGLTCRELSARAGAHGYVLPRSTVAALLARSTVPPEELLGAFVRACGARAEEWEPVRRQLAVHGAHALRPAADGEPPSGETEACTGAGAEVVTGVDPNADADVDAGADGETEAGAEAVAGVDPNADADADVDAGADAETEAEAGAGAEAAPVWPGAVAEEPSAGPAPEPRHSRIRRTLVGAIAVTGLVLAAVSVVALVRDGDRRPHRGQRPPVLTAPAEGPVRIRVIGSDLCLDERRGSGGGQIYQRACAGADVSRHELERLPGDAWRIVSVRPDLPVGCSGIPAGGRTPHAALEDSACGDPTRVERFTLEPYGSPPAGWRILPAGSATPGSCVTVVGDRGAEWSRLAQAPCTADARGQLFSFDRRD